MINLIQQAFWTAFYYFSLLLFAFGIMLVNLLCPVIIVLFPKRAHQPLLQWLSHQLFRLYMFLLEGSGLLRSNRTLLDQLARQEGGLLIVANHPNIIDAPIFFSRIPRLICVFKSSLKKGLWMSLTARTMGHLSNDGGLDLLRGLADALASGNKVLVFPEGTRTENDCVNPFNPGYALAAIRAKVAVQLVRIDSDTPVLSKKQPILQAGRFPGTFQFALGPVIEPGTFSTVRELNRFVESWFTETLKRGEGTARTYLPAEFECHESTDTLEIRFKVPDDPFYCRGHMPGNPIVPAYVQTIWLREGLHLLTGRNGEGVQLVRWKFLQPVRPQDPLVMQLPKKEGAITGRVQFLCGEAPVTRGRFQILDGGDTHE